MQDKSQRNDPPGKPWKELTNDEKLYKVRHSLSHIMAQAVLEKYPEAQLAIGPAIDTGFYYDFDLPQPLKEEQLAEIEERMRQIVSSHVDFIGYELPKKEAQRMVEGKPYKQELLDGLPEDVAISFYEQDGFVDLCMGNHVENSRQIDPKSFKLMSVAGAYWRGDEKRPMLTRIYGAAFLTGKELRQYLEHLREVEKRDHRRLGRELDLFSMHEEAGPGLVYWHPKGSRIRLAIQDFWYQQHFQGGYDILHTPHVGKSWLWETSGHLDFYKEGMYPSMEMDNTQYYTKPMNCPFHIMIYKNTKYSYRDLPLRWAEMGTVYRYEQSGALHGLLRVRGFTQDDAHIFCTPEQVEDEILKVLRFSLSIWRTFGFSDIKAYLATRPEKAVGDQSAWDDAIAALRKAIEAEGLDYEVDEGGGAFYGPKIDLKVRDALGREWQMSTVQFDYNLPERFDMVYVDRESKERRPIMIHRALLGSLERFFGVLIEHYAGAFPVWLAPLQVQIVPVAPPFFEYAKEVEEMLTAQGIRAKADLSDDRMNAKIRNAQTQKVPYTLILGEKEAEARAVSVRKRGGGQDNGVPLQDWIADIRSRIENRDLEV
ncbi:MAG: threonine--tRNA ligase [Spirochaetaceae bacterium]|nr:MAG: threonine--tRNA ligase [Spirochaetaceae bacterium]